ncbi:MAG: hypothetical protein ACI8QH_000961 [Flammeovirgaceae bacterium]
MTERRGFDQTEKSLPAHPPLQGVLCFKTVLYFSKLYVDHCITLGLISLLDKVKIADTSATNP